MTDDQLPPLHSSPLAPRPGEWDDIRRRVRRSARRRTAAVSLAAALAAAVPLAAVGFALDRPELDVVRTPTVGQAVEGVRTVPEEDLTRDHVAGELVYPREAQAPPIGGDHAPAPQACGVYAAPVPDENAVHSLEHGAVWLTHRPELDPQEVAQLREIIAAAGAYGLLSPRRQDAAVVATAWGRQLEVDAADDPRLEQFVRQYANGPQTPEPGALCDGETGMQFAAVADPKQEPPCASVREVFRISRTPGPPDGATPEQAAAAFAVRRGNGASFPLPSDGWSLLVRTAATARVVSGPATLLLTPVAGGWIVDGGSRCSTG